VIIAAGQSAGSYTTLLLFAGLAALMYFMIIRPNNKRRRDAMEMQNSLGAGDKVITVAGLHATVSSIDTEAGTITLEIAPGVNATFERGAIGKVQRADAAAAEAAEATSDTPSITESDVIKPGR
jgi:preprotein translocase subunit YajC